MEKKGSSIVKQFGDKNVSSNCSLMKLNYMSIDP